MLTSLTPKQIFELERLLNHLLDFATRIGSYSDRTYLMQSIKKLKETLGPIDDNKDKVEKAE